jgi:hypothetical protein
MAKIKKRLILPAVSKDVGELLGMQNGINRLENTFDNFLKS